MNSQTTAEPPAAKRMTLMAIMAPAAATRAPLNLCGFARHGRGNSGLHLNCRSRCAAQRERRGGQRQAKCCGC